MHRRGEQPLAFVVFFRVTQEVADGSARRARSRPPAPPPPIVPIGHLPAVPQGRGRADGVGPAQAGGHGCFKGERLLLAAVRGVGVFVQGQVGLGDVALWGGVALPGVGRLGQAGVVALQSLGGQWGATLAPISWWGDAPSVSDQRAVGKEGPRLGRDWGSCRRLRRGVLESETEGMELSLRDPVPCVAGDTWHVSLGLASSLLDTWLSSLTPPTKSHWNPPPPPRPAPSLGWPRRSSRVFSTM